MIVLRPEDLRDQAGMERAFRGYFEQAKAEYPGTFNVLMDAKLSSCDYAGMALVLSMETADWMSNPSAIVHGGVIAAAMDMAMGLLCRYFSNGHMTPTVDMSVSYLRPVPLHATAYIRAEITRRGASICSAVSRLWTGADETRPLATASGSYFVTRAQG